MVAEGRSHPLTTTLADSGVGEGSLVATPEAPPSTTLSGRPPALAISGGLIAGPTISVSPASTIIGRSAVAAVHLPHPSVSAEHARVRLDQHGVALMADLGSTNGTWLGGRALREPVTLKDGDVLRLGAVRVRWVASDHPDAAVPPPNHGAKPPFLRPPRGAPPAPPEPVPAPRTAASLDFNVPLSVTALVAPIVFAAVLVLATGSWRFALFALLSPLLVLGNWVEGKRRQHVASKGGDRRFKAAVGAFRDQLLVAGDAERRRRAELAPDPAEALRRAELPSTRLWERRADDPDHLVVHLGVGEVAWDPPVDGDRLSDAARQAVRDAARLAECPVTQPLRGGPVALVGDRAAALGVARSLVCQAATHQGPADLAVAVVTTEDGSPGWDWAKWLPHVLDRASRQRRLATEATAARALGSLESDEERPCLVVLDLPADAGALAEAGRLLRSSNGRVTAIVLADEIRSVPAWCPTIVELTDRDGSALVHQPRRATVSGPLLVAACNEEVARRWGRALARFRDPESPTDGARLPDQVDLASLLPVEIADPAALLRCWDEEADIAALAVGMDVHGVAVLDFERAGPFAVVIGAAGAGKSTLLRSLAAVSAAHAGPEQLRLLLWAAGADATFAPLDSLQHVAAAATGAAGRDRLLVGLHAELQRRAGDPSASHPLLLILIDDADTLAGYADTTLDELAEMAGRGATLGLSMVVAGRRWAGAMAPPPRRSRGHALHCGWAVRPTRWPSSGELNRSRSGETCLAAP